MKLGGQLFQQQSSMQSNILMVLVGGLVIWVLYKAFFKQCPSVTASKEKFGLSTGTLFGRSFGGWFRRR